MKLIGLFVLLCLLGACPPAPPKPPITPTDPVVDGGLPFCKESQHLTNEDLCKYLFTRETFLPCAACREAQGCIEPNAFAYCVIGSCFDDPLCEYQHMTASR